MTDVYSRRKRSEIMSHVRGSDTVPERAVQSLLKGMRFHFHLNDTSLPGSPDIVLPRHKKVIFVHGCFWHGHRDCARSARPTSNVRFWRRKLAGNVERDSRNLAKLRRQGWRALVIWGCESRSPRLVERKLTRFLKGRSTDGKTTQTH
jgi:DNA mismatch endonuclease (patch repair protein)